MAKVPQHSIWIASKTRNRAHAVVVAQNVLMRKLGVVKGAHVEVADFDYYLWLFKEGLTEEQVQMERELFVCLEPIPVEEGSVMDTAEA
jgi:hypothetical protein